MAIGRSSISSTKRDEITTQVLLSLIVKEPRICAAEILRNNRSNEAFAKGSRPKETFGQEFKKETCRSEPRCATRYEKHGAERVREILERKRERRETGVPLLEQALFAVARTDFLNSKTPNPPFFVHGDERISHCSIDRCLSPNKIDKIVAFAIIEDHGAPRCICLKGRRQENHALCVFCNFELHRNDSSRLNRHCSEFLRGDDETENRLASPTFPPWKGKAGHR